MGKRNRTSGQSYESRAATGRRQIKVWLDKPAQEALDGIVDATGQTIKEVVTRSLDREWSHVKGDS